MAAIKFDTLSYSKKMKSLGFTEQQAEGLADATSDFINENIANKTDILLLQKDISSLRAELKRDIKELEYKLTIRMGGMLATSVAILAALIKFGH